MRAANELKRSSLSTGAVAEAVGYQSEAAFQRAFKGHMGVTPAQWRKMQEPSGQGLFPTSKAESAISSENSVEMIEDPS
jgi:AraC-like DNA-binding protein